MTPSTPRPQDVLIVAPTGRDADLCRATLGNGGIPGRIFRSLADLRTAYSHDGAAALIVAEEALRRDGHKALCQMLERQPPWSRLPVLLLTKTGRSKGSAVIDALHQRSSLTLLDRPLSRSALLSAAAVAQHARDHQYDIRDHLEERDAYEAELQQSLAERDLLLAEVHHRVRNNLQMVLHLLTIEQAPLPAEAKAARDQSVGRVEAMALVHELLYESQDFGHFQLGTYLQRLTRSLLSLGTRTPKVNWHLAPLELGLAHAVPVALIAQEVISNAVKHSANQPLTLDIRIGASQGTAELAIGDDGPGLPQGLDPLTAGNMGGRLIRGLARQLDGMAEYLSPGKGTRFRLRFPL